MMVFQQKFTLILMIELGVWVIQACANFIRGGDTFQGKWLLWIMMVFQQKLTLILMIELGVWVIQACANFIRGGDTFQG